MIVDQSNKRNLKDYSCFIGVKTRVKRKKALFSF
ncbi:MAG: hypothetical protein ACJAZ2_000348, partial [Glaciecola sp.]